MRRASLPLTVVLALWPATLCAQTPAARVAPRPPALDAELGLRFYGRSLYFTDDLFRRLRPYRVVGVPSLAGELEFHPAALFSRGPASWFGLIVRGELTPYLRSSDAQDRLYDTTVYSLTVGARGRYPIGRFEFGVAVAYARQAFTIDRSSVAVAPAEGIPSVVYESLLTELSARAQILPRLAASARAGFLLPVGYGELGSEAFFPRVSGAGVSASLAAAFALTPALEARVSVDWRRYFLSMNPVAGDRLIAGGAADDTYGATLSVAFRR